MSPLPAPPPSSSGAASPGSSSSGPRILIVEDEFLIRMTLVEALADEGYDVVEAASGDDALPTLLADRQIALLLTDIKLPGAIDGRTLAARAREQVPHLPVIFMSGDLEAAEAGDPRDLFISKPYTLTDICLAARKLTG